jgi:4-amino-4-deoxy-L-arabinose transferase-like glycosyltransferase
MTGLRKLLSDKRTLVLVLVVLLALFLRVYRLSDYPVGLNADEAAIGYNAYSLLNTGKDEFGHSWPINFQSFNDFKPGLYFYLVLPWVKVLGLNEWAVRLPSAILGTLTVLVIFFLVKELFGPTEKSQNLGLLAALLLAISPWHLHFSRGGWETNVATFLMVLGSWLFLISLKKPKFFVFCVLSFASSMFTYHSARVVVPLLGLGLAIFNWRKVVIKKNWRWLTVAILEGGLLLAILLFSMTGEAGASRFSGVGIFADEGPLWRVNELRGQHTDPYASFPKIIHNKYTEYGIQFLDNWSRHFYGQFLFIYGDEIQRNRVPETGQLYLVEIPFLIWGLSSLLRKKPSGWQFLLWWLAVAPVASALTFQSPHAIRALNLVIPLMIITAYGIYNASIFFQEKGGRKLSLPFIVLCLALYSWHFSFYWHQYYVHYSKIYPAAWEDGFKELSDYVAKNQSRFDRIYITNKYDQPYILLAFFLRYPPAQFQKEANLSNRDRFGFSTVEHFGKYYFGEINWSAMSAYGRAMIIGTSEEIPDSATITKRVYFKDGEKEAFRIVEN